jgi:hypothetical protein
MPEAIVSRILRLPGYRVSACEADETAGTLWVRQTTPEPYYVCGGCGISVGRRNDGSWLMVRLEGGRWFTYGELVALPDEERKRLLNGIDRFWVKNWHLDQEKRAKANA